MYQRQPDVFYFNATGTHTLYHGSKHGLQGPIRPISRRETDFGRGFYMGEREIQAKTFISENDDPHLYELSFNLHQLKAVHVNGVAWALLVAYNRQKLEEFRETKLYEQIASITKNQDVVIGPIADDKMFQVLPQFFDDAITDETLLRCMQALRLGDQYVAKTPKACSPDHIKIVSHTILKRDEIEILRQEAKKRTDHADQTADQLIREERRRRFRSGYLLSEILEGSDDYELDLTPNPSL